MGNKVSIHGQIEPEEKLRFNRTIKGELASRVQDGVPAALKLFIRCPYEIQKAALYGDWAAVERFFIDTENPERTETLAVLNSVLERIKTLAETGQKIT